MALDDSGSGAQVNPRKIGYLPNPFGKYEVLGQLGQGGMGCVYKALDLKLGRLVALKIPHAHLLRDDILARFQREARTAAQWKHSHLCTVCEFDCIEGIHYLAMEFVEGKTLATLAERKLPQRTVANAIRKCALALALATVHQNGVLHRDLKPGNIMVNKHGEPIIMDFGLARHENDHPITSSREILGTLVYMPIEQMASEFGAVSPRSDIYSLGAVLYELLCGRTPFDGSSTQIMEKRIYKDLAKPSAHRDGVDTKLEAIRMKAMARLPQDRFSSMKEFAEALGEWILDEPTTTPDIIHLPSSIFVSPFQHQSDSSEKETLPMPPITEEKSLHAPAALWESPIPEFPPSTSEIFGGRSSPKMFSASKPPDQPRRYWNAVQLLVFCFLFAIIATGVILTIVTRDGTVEIVLSNADPQSKIRLEKVKIELDGKEIEVFGLHKPIRMKAGQRKIVVTGDELETEIKQFEVRRGTHTSLTISLRPKATVAKVTQENSGSLPPIKPLVPDAKAAVPPIPVNVVSKTNEPLTTTAKTPDLPKSKPAAQPSKSAVETNPGSLGYPSSGEVATEKRLAWSKHLGVPVEFTNKFGMNLALIPPGIFKIGSTYRGGGEKGPPPRDAEITKPMYFGVHEVTVAQFRQFVEARRYQTDAEKGEPFVYYDKKTVIKGAIGWDAGAGLLYPKEIFTWKNPGIVQADNHPVVCVSHNDAIAFCQWLSESTGQQYTLPTQAQWEYACRAGTVTSFHFGLCLNGDMANCNGLLPYPESIPSGPFHKNTVNVGSYPPNAFGLRDMHGNVYEWCLDWYGLQGGGSDPVCEIPSESGFFKVFRRGCWHYMTAHCSCDFIAKNVANYRSCYLGFRVMIVMN